MREMGSNEQWRRPKAPHVEQQKGYKRDRRRGRELLDQSHADVNFLEGSHRHDTASRSKPQSLRDSSRRVPEGYVDPTAPKRSEGRLGYQYGNGSGYRDPHAGTFIGRMEAQYIDHSIAPGQAFPQSMLKDRLHGKS